MWNTSLNREGFKVDLDQVLEKQQPKILVKKHIFHKEDILKNAGNQTTLVLIDFQNTQTFD